MRAQWVLKRDAPFLGTDHLPVNIVARGCAFAVVDEKNEEWVGVVEWRCATCDGA